MLGTRRRPDLPSGTRRETGIAAAAPNAEWAKFAASGVVPDLAAIHFIARAITPPGRPRRFDTRFFAVDAHAIAKRIEGVVGPDTELVELVWMPIDDTLKLDMPGITMAVLEELKIRTAGGFTHDLPVPFSTACNAVSACANFFNDGWPRRSDNRGCDDSRRRLILRRTISLT